MRILQMASFSLAVLLSGSVGFAAVADKKKLKAAKVNATKANAGRLTKSGGTRLKPNATASRPVNGEHLQREVIFDGSTVNGQYHSAGEAVAKVEQEKKMNDLIGMRHDFKDRMNAERERLKRGDAVAAD